MRARTASKVALVGKLFSSLQLEKKKTLCVVILTARSAFCLVTFYVAILYVANGAECFLSSYYRVFCIYFCLKPYMLLSYNLVLRRMSTDFFYVF